MFYLCRFQFRCHFNRVQCSYSKNSNNVKKISVCTDNLLLTSKLALLRTNPQKTFVDIHWPTDIT